MIGWSWSRSPNHSITVIAQSPQSLNHCDCPITSITVITRSLDHHDRAIIGRSQSDHFAWLSDRVITWLSDHKAITRSLDHILISYTIIRARLTPSCYSDYCAPPVYFFFRVIQWSPDHHDHSITVIAQAPRSLDTVIGRS